MTIGRIPSVEGGIQPTIVDAKGDLIVATAADTVSRLAVGTNDYVLTAASGETTGLKWAAIPAASFVGCSVYDTGDQTIANNTNAAVTWGSEDFDTDGFHSTSSNTSRFTIPSGKNGKYLIQASFRWDNNTTGDRTIAIFKNGAGVKYWYAIASGVYPSCSISHTFDLVATDYLEIMAIQNSGGNRTISKGAPGQGWASLTYLGA